MDFLETHRGILSSLTRTLPCMKTNLRTSLILSCVLGFALLAIWVLSRTPAREVKIPAESLPGGPELVSAPDAPASRSRLRVQRTKITSRAPEALSIITQTQPPEDPDEIRQWARENPRQAFTWMMSAAAGLARDSVAEIVCAQIAATDPAKAVALAERYSGGCSNLMENLVHQWAEQDEAAAYAYAVRQAPGEDRDRLLGRVAFIRSKVSPAGAAELVAQEIAPGAIQDEVAISVLHQWALRDPAQAFAWAQLFPEGALRDRALTEVENLVSAAVNQ
jgi:hypothetical protein